MHFLIWRTLMLFLSTPSARRATRAARFPALLLTISIHALREEGDTLIYALADQQCDFYPRHPRGGRRAQRDVYRELCIFLSTPSARRATRESKTGKSRRVISIHALREEGDLRREIPLHALSDFYPRPPRGGRRSGREIVTTPQLFLSTPSARRATLGWAHLAALKAISIHALREEGDASVNLQVQIDSNFYPRPPRGGRPRPAKLPPSTPDFYPRPPRGGRQHRQRQTVWKDVFLSTPSARRATRKLAERMHINRISIHALREEGDLFQRRPGAVEEISIHALREEGDNNLFVLQ